MTAVLENRVDEPSLPASIGDRRMRSVSRDPGWRSRIGSPSRPTGLVAPDGGQGPTDAVSGIPDVRTVDLGDLRELPITGVDVGELATMLASLSVGDLSDVALVNTVSAWQQVLNMAQARRRRRCARSRLVRSTVLRGFPTSWRAHSSARGELRRVCF